MPVFKKVSTSRRLIGWGLVVVLGWSLSGCCVLTPFCGPWGHGGPGGGGGGGGGHERHGGRP